tara:strand:+ start:748 stop:1104 length:357 start_codon:yes stop_codon:yes gene_type:complete
MANPMHDFTVQEILNKTYNYTSYAAETMANIGTTPDTFDNLGLSSSNPAREIVVVDVTVGGTAAGGDPSAGHVTVTINGGDEIVLKVGNLPFTFDKFAIESVAVGAAAADDIQVIAFF